MTPPDAPASRMVCAGCGADATPPYAFRCPRAGTGDDIDHILVRTPAAPAIVRPAPADANPFLRYRHAFHSYHVARAHGLADSDYADLVRRLDDEVARVEGFGFHLTPFSRADRLSDELGFESGGGVWVKDETGNVAGSHKARHLMGIMIYLLVVERLGLVPQPPPALAIASCGNAALAAAVIARAAARPLTVFIPPDAPAAVVRRLGELGAGLTTCLRTPAGRGDPCYLAFRSAVDAGALPFCCQGTDNGMTIEGGETIGFEMLDALGEATLDRVFLQVGGGALASAVIRALTLAAGRRPVVHAVQTRSAHPLARAYDRLAARVERSGDLPRELRYAQSHRSEFMWPWEETPRSIAHGILDDETYDWFEVVRAMLDTGGSPLLVDERELQEACELGRRTTRIDADHTGTSGLSGLLQLLRAGGVQPREKVAVIFSGQRRGRL